MYSLMLSRSGDGRHFDLGQFESRDAAWRRVEEMERQWLRRCALQESGEELPEDEQTDAYEGGDFILYIGTVPMWILESDAEWVNF